MTGLQLLLWCFERHRHLGLHIVERFLRSTDNTVDHYLPHTCGPVLLSMAALQLTASPEGRFPGLARGAAWKRPLDQGRCRAGQGRAAAGGGRTSRMRFLIISSMVDVCSLVMTGLILACEHATRGVLKDSVPWYSF